MTLGEFATLLDADPKWVQNAAAALGGRLRFTLPHARRLAVAGALAQAMGMPLARAWQLAEQVIRRSAGHPSPVPLPLSSDTVTGAIDLYRILARISTRLSWLRTEYQPRQRGRPHQPRDPIAAAELYGLDLGLLRSNLERTPAERLRRLDAMADFRRRVRRV